jgi:hypothetical protein
LCLIVVCCVAVASNGDDPKPPGPEWKKDGEYFKKKVEIEALRPNYTKASGTDYRVNLAHHKLQLLETDDGSHCSACIILGQDKSVTVQVRRDGKGEVFQHTFSNNRVIYYDFDRDGIFDAYADSRGKEPKLMILVDGAFVRVRASKEGFNYHPADGPSPRKAFDDSTSYSFIDGQWK